MKRRNLNKILFNSLISVAILCVFFGISLFLQYVITASEFIPALFVLAVFLISLLTDGYLWGILAALASMLAMNYAFTFPYFAFNFTIPENIVSALIMMSVTLLTGALTTKLKRSEAVRAEAELETMRANLLRAVSHDLRTPLTSVYGAATGIVENYDSFDDATKKQILQGITEDSEWLIRMVENLLSVTKLDGGSVKLAKTSTVPEELVDSVISKFHKRYPDVKVDVSLPDEFITVPMDALLIEQVLVNLLENAVQHAKGMTELSLTVKSEGEFAVFSVTDNGCGIPQAELPSIFSGKIHSDDKDKRGMGIGLSVCATIIKAHEGEIYAKNVSPSGACFSFKLLADVCEDYADE